MPSSSVFPINISYTALLNDAPYPCTQREAGMLEITLSHRVKEGHLRHHSPVLIRIQNLFSHYSTPEIVTSLLD